MEADGTIHLNEGLVRQQSGRSSSLGESSGISIVKFLLDSGDLLSEQGDPDCHK